MAFPAFFDTSAIFGGLLNDVFLTLAEQGLFRPLWSADVLEELRRSLIARGIGSAAVDYRITAMRSAFPDAEISGYADLIPAMTNDKDDRHVLAAAVRANAEVIVTFNLRHFPEKALQLYELEARHPDDFLLDQLDLHQSLTLDGVRTVISSYERPALTMEDFLERLRASGVPRFAERVNRVW